MWLADVPEMWLILFILCYRCVPQNPRHYESGSIIPAMYDVGLNNAGFKLSGSLTVYGPDGATRTLHVNDSLIELVGIPHSGANEGDENAVVLVFYAGQMGQPLSRPAP